MRRVILVLSLLLVLAAPAIAQNEPALCHWLFTASVDFTSTAGSAINLAAEAVWGAYSFTGSLPTLYGTLTETSSGEWTYTASPADKLVIKYYGGPTVEFVYTHFEGFMEKGWEGFVDSHHMTFTVVIAGSINLAIDSYAIPPPGGGKTDFTQDISGTMLYDGVWTTLSLHHTGSKQWVVESGYAEYWYQEKCTGTASTASSNATIDDQYYNHFIHNSNQGAYAGVKGLRSNSSLTTGGTLYKYNDANVDWAAWTDVYDSCQAGIYNMADDPSYWSASGTMSKNGAQYGTVQFSGSVERNSYGPVLLLAVPGVDNYLIHPLLWWWLTGVEDRQNEVPDGFVLMQNYPNPFNPMTEIRFQMPERAWVTLSVYDMLGREVSVLVDGKRDAGSYVERFDAAGLASGVYLCRLTTSRYTASRRMLLLR